MYIYTSKSVVLMPLFINTYIVGGTNTILVTQAKT